MDPRVDFENIRLFSELPLLPLCEISKHFNARAIAMTADYSKKWEKIVRKRRNRTSVWEIRMTKDQIGFWIAFPDTAQNFCLFFKLDFLKNSEQPFAKRMQFHSFRTLKILSRFFPPTSYGSISVSLGPRCPKFPFRFLSRLPRGTATYVLLQGNLEVNGANLVKFLEKVQVKDRDPWVPNNLLDIQVKIKNLVMSDKIRFENNRLYILDARFLTPQSTPKLGAYIAEIGVNNFTSQDLNAFLKSWVIEERQNVTRRSVYTIDLREDQEIKLEEVMEGLNPHVGKPRIRDRWHINHPIRNKKKTLLNPKVTDMNEGLDITSSQGQLGTVLLEPNRFTFVTWLSEFNWEVCEREMRALMKECGENISNKRSTLERWQKPNERRKLSAEQVQSRINACRTKIRQMELNLAKSCGIYQKLITEWNND